MQKPPWRVLRSTRVVDSPFMRLRADEIELPDGSIVPNYYVRESEGFVVIFALTQDGRVILERQYRYGSDAIHLELPAGMLAPGEAPLACAARELAEETGYEAARWESAGEYTVEPVRSAARARIYVAFDARRSVEPHLDPTEILEVEFAAPEEFRAMLADGRIDSGTSIAGGYRALDYLGTLR